MPKRYESPAMHARPAAILESISGALPSHVQSADRKRAEAVGMDDYLVKPVRREELYGKIERKFVEKGIAG